MPFTPLSSVQLSAFRTELQEQQNSPTENFALLRQFNESFSSNAEQLAIMEYSTSLLGTESQYNEVKAECKAAYQALKQQQKHLDERILIIEQKLYLGLPEDLEEMEKVITEQESIVADQEKINLSEERLLEKMRNIDIEHGKQLALLEQSKENRSLPLKSKQAAFRLTIDQAEKQLLLKTKIFGVAPVIVLPILLDVIATKTGIQKSGENHYIFSHYVFFLSFLILELFFVERFKSFASQRLSTASCLALLSELETALIDNNREIKKLENECGLSLNDVLMAYEDH